MDRLIRLWDIPHVPTPRSDRYSDALMEKARAALAARGLLWDNSTGRMYDNHIGLLERLLNPSDYEPHTSMEDVMRWEFNRYISNSASRLARGLDA